MKPKIIEKFSGYVVDLGKEDFYLINETKNEQLQVPLDVLTRPVKDQRRQMKKFSATL